MKNTLAIVLGGSVFYVSLLHPRPLFAQVCQGDEAAAAAYQKSLIELVGKVQKESLEEFEKAYHQQACLTTLTLCYTAANDAVNCLEKAAKDPTATKAQIEADKAKRDAYAKLRDQVGQDRNALQAAKTPEEAKALIAKFPM